MNTVTNPCKQHRMLFKRAQQAHAAGDPQAKFVIAWMEQLLQPIEEENPPRDQVGQVRPSLLTQTGDKRRYPLDLGFAYAAPVVQQMNRLGLKPRLNLCRGIE